MSSAIITFCLRLSSPTSQVGSKAIIGLHRKALFSSTFRYQHRLPEPNENEDNKNNTASFQSPPVLFIKKHECLVDVGRIGGGGDDDNVAETVETPTSDEDTTRKKVKFVMKTANEAKTLETLQEALLLRRRSEVVVQPPPKTTIFTDFENIRDASAYAPVKLDLDQSVVQWSDTAVKVRNLPGYYLNLSKANLTLLVCATAAAGYAMAPAATSTSFNFALFAVSTVGIGLVSCAANAINQYMEVPFDSQMSRTKNRVLVRGSLSPLHAVIFAGVTATAGTMLLANYVNTTAAILCFSNLVLYTCVYTPMKRISIANTWVGSVVGAIPPVIGYVSASGGVIDAGAFVLGAILYAWQFPHFNSLSWNLRADYSRAGYRMTSVIDPDLCRRVALRYSVVCTAVCSVAAPMLDVTTTAFALDSLPLNLYLMYLAYGFYRKADSSSSRKLFRYTLIHLPLILTLMFISKKTIGKKESADVGGKKEVVKVDLKV